MRTALRASAQRRSSFQGHGKAPGSTRIHHLPTVGRCRSSFRLVGGIRGWFGWSARRRAAKPVELTAGGIEGKPERLFRFVGVDQWTTLFVDAFVQYLRDVFPSQRRVLMQVSNDLPAQCPQVVHVLLNRFPG